MVEAMEPTSQEPARRGRPPKDRQPPPLPKVEAPSARISALFRAVELAPLPASSKSVLNVLLRQVDWTTWTYPSPILRENKGLSMAELGQRCGWAGRKTPQRVLPRLEGLGLVKRVDRGFTTNGFILYPDAILALGEEGLKNRKEFLDEAEAEDRLPARRTKETRQLHQDRSARRRAAQDAGTPPAHPAWAIRAAHNHALPAERIEACVRRVIEAVVGRDQADTRQGEEPRAKRVMTAWTADLKPNIDEWSAELVLDLQALRACEEPAARKWRATNSSEDFRWLTREKYPALRALAKAHRAGLHHGCGGHPVDTGQVARPPPEVALYPEDWLKRGRRLEPCLAPATGLRWNQVIGEMRGRIGATNTEVWIEPLTLLEEGAQLVLGAPNSYFGSWVQEHYGALLGEVAGPYVLILPPEARG